MLLNTRKGNQANQPRLSANRPSNNWTQNFNYLLCNYNLTLCFDVMEFIFLALFL